MSGAASRCAGRYGGSERAGLSKLTKVQQCTAIGSRARRHYLVVGPLASENDKPSVRLP